jgi:hypothetical protein
MKKVILVFCFIPYTAFSQLSFTFEAGKLTGWVQSVADHWNADTASALSGSYSLHHVFDNSDAGTDQAGTRLTGLRPDLAETEWSFLIRHGTDPSASNNWAVFLLSDADPASILPGAAVNGYAVGVNLAGYDDSLRLWKFRNGTPSAVKAFPVNWQTYIGTLRPALINVKRDIDGNWTLTVSDEQQTFSRTADCTDRELFGVHWFGVFYRYTSSRDRLLWIDNISVNGLFEAPVPPVIREVRVRGDSSIEAVFSKEIHDRSIVPGNFTLQPGKIKATTASLTDAVTVRLQFGIPLPNKTACSITAQNICDTDSLCAGELVYDFVPAFAEPGDVIITEIMADPSPPVSLPEREYAEIFNRTGYSFSLGGWNFISGSTTFAFPATDIHPGQYLILCRAEDTVLFRKFGSTVGFSTFPTLSNEGNSLALVNSSGKMVHAVRYSAGWYGDRFREEGGWSLEMTDTCYPFFYEGNWKASVSPEGGTPGQINSVSAANPDLNFRGILNVFPDDSLSLSLDFSEPVKQPEDLYSELSVSEVEIVSVSPVNLSGLSFRIMLKKALLPGRIYTLSALDGITDYAGNLPVIDKFSFGLPSGTAEGDIRFNEIMFNPLPGDEDYLELCSVSANTVNVRDLYLVSVNDETGQSSDRIPVCDTDRCLIPGAYYALTVSRQNTLRRYSSSDPSCIFQVHSMPSMPDDAGHLRLLNKSGLILDEMRYSEKMHFTLLSGFEGIALEKIRPSSESGDRSFWHSASGTSGWGTPGSPNSVLAEPDPGSPGISLSSTRITPDNDGYEDELVMDFSLEDLSNVISADIFSETGNLVRRVARNTFAARKFSLVWDATADDGSLVDSGIYIILVTGYDSTGRTFRWKKVCSVLRR